MFSLPSCNITCAYAPPSLSGVKVNGLLDAVLIFTPSNINSAFTSLGITILCVVGVFGLLFWIVICFPLRIVKTPLANLKSTFISPPLILKSPTDVGSSAVASSTTNAFISPSAFPALESSSAFPALESSSAFPALVSPPAFPALASPPAFPALASPSAFPALASPPAFPALVSPSAFPALVLSSIVSAKVFDALNDATDPSPIEILKIIDSAFFLHFCCINSPSP